MDDKHLWEEPYPGFGMLRAFISNASGDGERRRVLCVRFDVVSVLTFGFILRLFHCLLGNDFAGLAPGYSPVGVISEPFWMDRSYSA